ncbi:hypothetical protein GDO81_026207 [Engystomops pustulosus]|uniref:Uncharacterized protein n=1 Tax=Engystomops pustulosus TaxID=76066 RepID=A0AAV6YR59_ENGPU|nr:hypothetical protein GDO81_026207 [Engystomops pustulosus]
MDRAVADLRQFLDKRPVLWTALWRISTKCWLDLRHWLMQQEELSVSDRIVGMLDPRASSALFLARVIDWMAVERKKGFPSQPKFCHQLQYFRGRGCTDFSRSGASD